MPAMSATPPRIDKRLLGTWRSDRTATIAEWRFAKRFSALRRRKFLDIFGKLRLRFTRARVFSILGSQNHKQRYEVFGTDSDSVAIRYEDTQLTHEWRLQHIHFEGRDRYWIALGRNREWFRRVRTRSVGAGGAKLRR